MYSHSSDQCTVQCIDSSSLVVTSVFPTHTPVTVWPFTPVTVWAIHTSDQCTVQCIDSSSLVVTSVFSTHTPVTVWPFTPVTSALYNALIHPLLWSQCTHQLQSGPFTPVTSALYNALIHPLLWSQCVPYSHSSDQCTVQCSLVVTVCWY